MGSLILIAAAALIAAKLFEWVDWPWWRVTLPIWGLVVVQLLVWGGIALPRSTA